VSFNSLVFTVDFGGLQYLARYLAHQKVKQFKTERASENLVEVEQQRFCDEMSVDV